MIAGVSPLSVGGGPPLCLDAGCAAAPPGVVVAPCWIEAGLYHPVVGLASSETRPRVRYSLCPRTDGERSSVAAGCGRLRNASGSRSAPRTTAAAVLNARSVVYFPRVSDQPL